MRAETEPIGRVTLWIVAPISVLMTVLFTVTFGGKWNVARVVFCGAFAAISLGLVLALIDQKRFWWGPRLAAFVIACGFLFYLYRMMWVSDKPLEITQRRSQASPFNSVLAFLFFGVPCFIYAFWGSPWGPDLSSQPRGVGRAAAVTAVIARWVFAALSGLVLIVGLVRQL